MVVENVAAIKRLEELEQKLKEMKKIYLARLGDLGEHVYQLKRKLHKMSDSLPKTSDSDDYLVRKVEWCIKDFSNVRDTPKNEAIRSDPFFVMGVSMHFEFFPQGRSSTWADGYCALFLWAPAGVQLSYQLSVGNQRHAPDKDVFHSHMGHGHSNFCYVASQWDKEKDSLTIGLDIMHISVVHEVAPGLRLINEGPEGILKDRLAVVVNNGVQRVEWKVSNALRRIEEVPRGCAMTSPLFSVAGLRDSLIELYPNGVQNSNSCVGKEDYCGLYLRCSSGNSVVLTLFVGEHEKGPIKTDFDGTSSKGLPEFCRLKDQLRDGETDVIVGVDIAKAESDAGACSEIMLE